MAGFTMPQTSLQPGINMLAQGLQARQDRQNQNALSALLPQAMAGDQNALMKAYAIDPRGATAIMQYQAAQEEASTRKQDRQLRLDEASRERLGGQWKEAAGYLLNVPEGQEAAAWPAIVAQYPDLQLPPQYDPNFRARAMAILGKVPEAPKPITPTDDMREFEFAQTNPAFAQYQEKMRRAGAANNSVSFGTPMAGVDAQGNPVYFQPSKDGGAPAIVPGVRPAPNKAEQPTESERTGAFLWDRVQRAKQDIAEVTKKNPGSARPEFGGVIAGAIGGETARNFANSEDRQRIEAAQMDALDAALTLATGAAYTKEQLESQRRSHFPQIGDTPATAAEKNRRFNDLVKAAELKAGRALPKTEIPSAGAGNSGGFKYLGKE